ncbi:MAG: lipid carrier--UDP-N-acetylgalactosaminyltransferase [Anaerobutyricum hallii]|uniref:PglD-related sugar-binding protein n=1 Tax=Anaerobutyricum hallii TaxID=39488 RepID=UPI00242F1FDA|nr:lipid carrier--UDP-N-acetylgalactosaminyltransferase [Anaerobutyricum hallii]MDD6587955.1 lipid carrier--UDP-N-acetylgalactosaminyltransferase [Anaerobutyricum hallii]
MCRNKNQERLLIVGAGGFGRVVSEHARRLYDCAFIDDGYEADQKICDIPVLGHISDLGELRAAYDKLIVAIGNNVLREKIYGRAIGMGYTFPNIICDSVYVSPYAEVGWGCVFLNNVVIQNGSSVGNGVLLNPGVEIHHGCSVADYALIYTNSVIRTEAKVGNRVRIGSNVSISNGIIVRDDADIENGMTL